MFRQKIERFLRDEDGGYAIWGLLWFMLYVGIGGLAVDITDAYRTQSMLQATADAAALAGAISPLKDESEVDAQAIKYAALNMGPGFHGNVLTETDVDIGVWNFATREFSEGGAEPNAVRAITRRADDNSNPLATNFLRIVGLRDWDVTAEAVAAFGLDACINNGIVAGKALDVKPHTNFKDLICLIGVEQVLFRKNDTTFGDGVYVGAGCLDSDKKCIGPGNQVLDNADFLTAFGLDTDGDGVIDADGNYDDQTRPVNAERLRDYIAAVRDMPSHTDFDGFLVKYNVDNFVDYSGYEYLFPDAGAPTLYPGDSVLPATTTPYTIYDLTNCAKNGYEIPEGTYDRVAIVANCPISFKTDGVYKFTNSLIASTNDSNGRMSIKGQAKVNLGTSGCGGGNEMYSLGDVDFASDGDFANLRILVQGSIHFSASSDSQNGTDIEATGDVFLSSGANNEADGSTYGLCGDSPDPGPKVLSLALVH